MKKQILTGKKIEEVINDLISYCNNKQNCTKCIFVKTYSIPCFIIDKLKDPDIKKQNIKALMEFLNEKKK